jgi:hypothetical protein
VTISDSDLEGRLRDLRYDMPLVPLDLAQRTRDRHRAQRRRRRMLGAVACVAAVVFVGVPLVASGLGEDHRSAPAAPSHAAPALDDGPSLYDIPTRGSLAHDDAWLEAVAAREWTVLDAAYEAAGAPAVPDPPLESRRVAFAGDVSSGRVALVLGTDGSNRLSHAWFTGPEGAAPDQMTQATTPSESGMDTVMALVDAPAPDAESLTVVVVARPGDTADIGFPIEVDRDGVIHRDRTAVSMDDNGIVVNEIFGRQIWLSPTTDVQVHRGSRAVVSMITERSARLGAESISMSLPADPRGLLDDVDRSVLRGLTGAHLADYGVTSEQVGTTLLAEGPLDASTDDRGQLIGATFPSGATIAWIETYSTERPGEGASLWELPGGPAGTALLDRVLAVRVLGGLMVSAPSGVSAQAVDARGTVLATIPLRQGGGAGPLVNAGGATRVRVLDAAGGVVVETPITEPDR